MSAAADRPSNRHPSFEALRRLTAGLRFQRYDVPPLDHKGLYGHEPAREFPFELALLEFSTRSHLAPSQWHRYLELFAPVEGGCRFRSGGAEVAVRAGDVLLVDNLKLHAVVDLPQREMRVVVIRFLPELVQGVAAGGADELCLLPFLHQSEEAPNLMRLGQGPSAAVHEALAALVAAWAGEGEAPALPAHRRAAVRGHFLVLLHHLALHFRAGEALTPAQARQKRKRQRLRALLEHIDDHFEEKLGLDRAARMVGVSRPQLARLFREATGTSLVAYLTKVRLHQAMRLLRETDASVAEIAARVGFDDPTYFDRRFRQLVGRTPGGYRQRP